MHSLVATPIILLKNNPQISSGLNLTSVFLLPSLLFISVLHNRASATRANAKRNIETQHLATKAVFQNNLVNAREREGILRAGLVEVGEVDTHALLPSFLGDDDGIHQPLRVSYLPDDPCCL